MAALRRDRITDDGVSLRGRRGRLLPTCFVIAGVGELGFGISRLTEGSASGVFPGLSGVLAFLLALFIGRSVVVDAAGVRLAGGIRRLPWSEIVAVEPPDAYEGSVVVVRRNKSRTETGFPTDLRPRILSIADREHLRLRGPEAPPDNVGPTA